MDPMQRETLKAAIASLIMCGSILAAFLYLWR